MRTSLLVLLALALLFLALPAWAEEGAAPAPASNPDASAPEDRTAKEPAPGPTAMDRAMRDYLDRGTDPALGAAASFNAEEIAIPIRDQVIPAAPGQGHEYGLWTGRWLASETLTWDSNIYLTEDDEEEDLISITTLGARFTRAGSAFAADATAALSYEAYQDHTDESYLGGYARAGVTYRFGSAFATLTARFTRRQDAIQYSAVEGGATVAAGGDRVTQLVNDATLAVGLDFVKWGAEARYQNTWWDYGWQLNALDAMQHQITGLVRYEWSPKLELNVQAEARWLNYDRSDSPDYDTQAGYAGIIWRPTEKLRIDARAGWLNQSIDHGSTTCADEYDNVSASLLATWTATEKLEATLGYTRDVYPGTQSGSQAVHLLIASLRWQLAPMWQAGTDVTYQSSDPGDAARSDLYSATLRLSYQVEDWLSTSLLYAASFRRSGAAAADYDDHRIALQLAVTF